MSPEMGKNIKTHDYKFKPTGQNNTYDYKLKPTGKNNMNR